MSKLKKSQLTWMQMKQLEIGFLDRFPTENTSKGSKLPAITKKKWKASRNIKLSQMLKASESSLEDIRAIHEVNSYQVLYTYQRINLCHYNWKADQPYFKLKYDQKKTLGFLSYTTSGQSAISLAFLCLKDCFGELSIFCGDKPYYETRDFFEKFKIPIEKSWTRFKSSKKMKLLYLDSSAQISSVVKQNVKADLVVVDTTCWSLGSEKIQNLVDQYLNPKTSLILLRSHIKLDCLGTELNRLGSILFMSQTRQRQVMCRKFVASYDHFANYFTGRAEVSKLYPFLKNHEFHRINEAWILRHIQSNKLFLKLTYNLFQEKKINVLQFDHGLFFWLQFKNKNNKTVNSYSKKLVEILNKKNVEARLVAGFPWDFVAVVVFDQRVQKKLIPTLRVSIPDLNPARIGSLIASFKLWLNDIEKGRVE